MINNKKLNILILTPKYAIYERQDLLEDTKAIHYLVKYWRDMNAEVTVVHTYHHYIYTILKKPIKLILSNKYINPKTDDIEGVKVSLMEIYQPIPTLMKLKNSIFSILMKKQLENLERHIEEIIKKGNKKPDIIVAHFPSVYIDIFEKIGEKYRCPKIGIMHISDINLLKKDKSNKLIKRMENIYDGIGFRSNSIEYMYKKIGGNIKNSFLVNSGIPDDMLDITNNKDNRLEPIKRKNILFVGKFIKRKNLDKLIMALSKLKNKYKFTLNVIGEGTEYKNIENIINEYNMKKHVNLMGTLSREMVFDEMKKSDIFVMPSVNETLGLVYMEAMASGCITIGTKGEGIDGIILDGINGFLLDEISIESLEKMLEKVLNLDINEIKRIKQSAYKTMSQNTETLASERYLNNIKKILKNYKQK